MAQPLLGELAQDAYDQIKIAQPEDELLGWPLANYIGALSDILFQPIDDLAKDGENGEPGWSIVLDLDRIPDEGLPYIAQFIGVEFPSALTPAQMRERIETTDGWNRGTKDSIVGALQPYLTGSQTVIFRERRTSAYTLEVVTYASETPDSAAALAAMMAQKPAGIVLTYNVRTGQDYQSMYLNNATYQTLFTNYATYQGVVEATPGT